MTRTGTAQATWCPVTKQRAPAILAGHSVCQCDVCRVYFLHASSPNDGFVSAQIATLAHLESTRNARGVSNRRKGPVGQPSPFQRVSRDEALRLFRAEKTKRAGGTR